MWKLILSYCLLAVLVSTEAAVIEYHHYGTIPNYHTVATTTILQAHPGYTIVAPLTKLAHITYDSVPMSHTPFEHVPLFQRISHVKAQKH